MTKYILFKQMEFKIKASNKQKPASYKSLVPPVVEANKGPGYGLRKYSVCNG